MFQRTFAVAKEVRSTTEIGAHSVSMAAAAVRLSQRIFDKISEQHVLFIGAGEMIDMCATHFNAQAPISLTLATSTLERGEAVAQKKNKHTKHQKKQKKQQTQNKKNKSSTASSLPIIGLGLVD